MMGNNDDLIIEGPPLYKPSSKISVGIQLNESLARNSDKLIFVQAETNAKVTFRTYFESTCKLAQALKNADFRQNDVATVCSQNNLVFFEPVIASLYLGITLSPINHNYTENEMLHIVNLTRPKVAFCSYAVADKFVSIQKKCTFLKRIIVIDSEKEIPQTESMENFKNNNTDNYFDAKTFKPVNVNVEDQIAVILCSSGTTGLSKGVMISHSNINFRINHSGDPNIHIIDGGVKIGVLPFFHGYGFLMTLGSIINGETVVALSKFNEELFYSTIQKYRTPELSVVPPILTMMAKSPLVEKYDFSSVKCFISGAAPLSKHVEDAVKKRLNISIRQGYGLTEATHAVILMPLGVVRPGSSGKVLPGMFCKVRDPETGKTLGPLQVGEVCIKGGLVAKGYVNNPKATGETFGKDGWIRTGDMAYYDEEGFFYTVDRLKELIKYKGFQVAPAELEALLLKHPKIRDAGVVGLPNEFAGELPLAFVVKQDGVKLSENDVKKYVEQNVSRAKWLHGGVIFIQAIPKNLSGKILRRNLRNMSEINNVKSKL